MTLREDAIADHSRLGPECGIPRTIRTLTEPLRGELVEAIADPTVQAKAITRVLREKHNVELSSFTINRHRRGECSCRS